jgi:pimeloyl-ACP methyl ester carboxylesterase
MAQTNISGVNISYDDLGQGEEALLLLPAWCQSRAVFQPILEKCAANRRTLSLDWRGHGQSASPSADFGPPELVADALAVIEASGVDKFIPVTVSHAGWVGIELHRRLGDRVPKIIHTDWLVVPPPPEYMGLVNALASLDGWEQAKDILFKIWLEGETENQALISFIRDDMGSVSGDMWQRSGRGIASCYHRGGYPLAALQNMESLVPVLHIYAQPGDPGYLQAQQDFATQNPWYRVHKLEARSHFPTFEVPDEIVATIEQFVTSAQ